MQEPLAIVGMSCRLPGADGLEAFWDLISRGDIAWGPLPEERLPRDLYFHPEKNQRGKSYSELGSLIPDRRVDEAKCPITEEMRSRYDIAHHLFLEVASFACRDAGLDPFAMPGGLRTGVYLGHTGGSSRINDMVYASGIDQTAPLFSDLPEAVEVLGVDAAAMASAVTDEIRARYPGRRPGEMIDLQPLGGAKIVHEALKLEGPYLVVDAACASSLQALAIGARSLFAGGVDQAIVGGASYYKSDSHVVFSAAQSVSNNGSYPFGQEADGLVTGEGYVALVLKTLSRAVADGDRIRAVIRGLGISSDGRGRSLWAPRSEGQVLAVQRAYGDMQELAEVDYMEAHATSTQVGDATELDALASLVSKNLRSGRQIPIGSVKANIGHTLETAGLASLVKVVLAMEHGQIPPGSTCKTPNEDFDWQGGPFTLPRVLGPWPRPASGVRTAAVNAFGIGGLNVHVALREHQAVEKPQPIQATSPEPVAIIGAGCVMPDALDREAFFALLESGRSAIGSVPKDRWDADRALDPSAPRTHHTTAALGGFVRGFEYDWRRHKVPPKQIAAADPLQFMLLESADSALADAGLLEKGFDRTRTGVIVGTLFGGDFRNQLQMGLRLPETGRIFRQLLNDRGVSPGDIERIIAAYEEKVLERYPSLVDETGSFTSSTLASRLTKTFDLMGGAFAFDAGKCSGAMAIAAALDMLRSGENDMVLCAAGDRYLDLVAFEDLSLSSRLAVEPTSPSGTGQGMVPGEGAVVLVLKRLTDAVAAGDPIRGVIRGAAVESARTPHEATRNAIHEAMRQAKISSHWVGAVEVAGSGDLRGQQQQMEVLADQYGAGPGSETTGTACGSLDGIIGQTGAAAGAAGVLKMTHALARGVMPVNVGSAEDATGGYLQASPNQALPIAAADPNGYRAATVTVADERQVGHVIIDNGKPLPQQARSTQTNQPLPAATPKTEARVAALFPGQGSQYTDMFRDLVATSPEARVAMERIDRLARQLGEKTLADIAWKRDNALGVGVWETQWAIYLGDLFAWEVLRDMGMRVDVIASHSFGEFPSLSAAGAWTAEVGGLAARCRGDAVEQVGPKDGAMLSVLASQRDMEDILAPFENVVWVCAENSPDQVVVGGQSQNVEAIEAILEAKKIHFKRLAVPCPYHTPLLAASALKLSIGISYLSINVPQIPVYSSTTASRVLDSGAIRESLARQMTETVQWASVVERLYEEGVRTFVEVGPLGVLSGLVRRVLKGKTDIQLIQFDQKSEAAPQVIARLRTQLAAAGALEEKKQNVTKQEKSIEVVMQYEEEEREKEAGIVAFDATERRRARNRSGSKAKPITATQKDDQQQEKRKPVAVSVAQHAEATTPQSPPAGSNGNGHLPQTAVKEQIPAASQGVTTGSRLRPTGEGDSLAGILSGMYAEYGVAPPLAASPAGAVDRFWQALAEMFDLGAKDRVRVLEAADGEALERLLSAAGGKAEWLKPSVATKAAPAVSSPPTPPPTADSGVLAANVEAFLIDFVVEQTGYPSEIVELDVDLEADLGIDSIRKAQMMGEVGQKYGLEADPELSLDDFPTLRHLLDYIVPRVTDSDGEPSDAVAVDETLACPPVAAPPATPEVALEPAPAPAAETPAVNGNGAVRPVTTTPAAAAPVADGAMAAAIEAFLIDFVVEQTGYPEEIVELDVDLEADLGIDSIRKAQMMGEVGQKYGLEADPELSLDDFPTLRHLLDYIVPRVTGSDGEPSDAMDQTVPSHGDYHSNGHASVVAEPVTSASYQAGLQIGRSSAAAIAQWSRSVAQSPAQQSVDCAIGSDLQEHLEGVAEGAQVEVAVLAAAVADPTRVVGNCDLLLDVPPPESNVAGRVRGFAMTFTRHIQLDHLSFDSDTLSGCFVTATGMPGAVVGWNDAGMLAIVGPHASEQSSLSPGMPVGQVIQQIAQKCRSFADVRQLVDSGDLERPPAGMSVLVADLSAGGIHEITPRGEIHDKGHQMVSRNRISPLTRILMDGHSQNPAQALGELATNNSSAALSAACSWLAITIEGQQATVAAGSPTGSLQCGRNFDVPLIALEPQREAILAPLEIPADAVTRRYLLEMRPLGPPRAARTLRGEQVLLLGSGPLAEPLARAIRRAGGNVGTAECKNREQAIQAITAAESRGAVHHLVLLARDPDGECLAWPAEKEARVESMFFATQQWFTAREAAGDLAAASLTALVDLGGAFGLSGHISQVEGGAICGLLKNLNREYPAAHVRVVDAVSQLPTEILCERFVAEMCDAAGPVEIGLSTSGRHVAAVRHEELAGPASHLPDALQRGSVWMVTGGARGVTAACSQQLAARYGVTLALVGSTQPAEIDPALLALDAAGLKQLKGETMVSAKNRGEDPRKAWGEIEKSLEIHRTLAALSVAGAAAHYEVCDLANEAQVKQLVDRVTHNLGPVRGLIHGAGYEASCRFSKKTPEGLAATLGPKCDGLAHLLHALHDAPLGQLVAFGSTSGRFGGHGQAGLFGRQ